MTASASAVATGRSAPGCEGGPASTDSISGAEGADCELACALDPPRTGMAKQEAGSERAAGSPTDWITGAAPGVARPAAPTGSTCLTAGVSMAS
eukprot:12585798-Alexandrium_andersonii.AAC.1